MQFSPIFSQAVQYFYESFQAFHPDPEQLVVGYMRTEVVKTGKQAIGGVANRGTKTYYQIIFVEQLAVEIHDGSNQPTSTVAVIFSKPLAPVVDASIS